jgi:hypothetical protein
MKAKKAEHQQKNHQQMVETKVEMVVLIAEKVLHNDFNNSL